MIVDTHVHVVAEDRDRYPLDAREPEGGWYREVPVTAEQLLGRMDAAGVDRAVLVQAVGAYRFDNRYVLDSARAHPERCTSVVCVDTTAPGAAETTRRLGDAGARGLRWWAIDGAPLAEPRTVWRAAATARMPVVATLLAPRLEELTRALAALPPVTVALDHCGFADLSAGVPPALAELAAFPHATLKVSSIVLEQLTEHGDVREGLAGLAAGFGAERLMWGSDYPQTHDRPYEALVELARHAASGLDAEARAAFLGGTALRLWPELAA